MDTPFEEQESTDGLVSLAMTEEIQEDDPLTQSTSSLEQLKNKIFELAQDPEDPLGQTTTRFSGVLDTYKLKEARIVIVGAGGIGSHLVRTLVGMGAENLLLIDFDRVEAHNCGPQSHNVVDIGRYKVEAIQENLLRYKGTLIDISTSEIINGWEQILQINDNQPIDFLITGVDNMEFRNQLNAYTFIDFRNKTEKIKYYIDARMTLGTWNVYALPTNVFNCIATYDTTSSIYDKLVGYFDIFKKSAVFTSEEQIQEACTERAIIYTGTNIASYIAAHVHYIIDSWATYKMDIEFTETQRGSLFLSNAIYESTCNTLESFFNTQDKETKFKWVTSFDARTWHGVARDTSGALASMYQDMIKTLRNQTEDLQKVITEQQQMLEQITSTTSTTSTTPIIITDLITTTPTTPTASTTNYIATTSTTSTTSTTPATPATPATNFIATLPRLWSWDTESLQENLHPYDPDDLPVNAEVIIRLNERLYVPGTYTLIKQIKQEALALLQVIPEVTSVSTSIKTKIEHLVAMWKAQIERYENDQPALAMMIPISFSSELHQNAPMPASQLLPESMSFNLGRKQLKFNIGTIRVTITPEEFFSINVEGGL